jgi:hypothetical protein
VLPNDPALQGLTDVHMHWILAHAADEAAQIRSMSASGGSAGSGGGGVITHHEVMGDFGLDKDEFTEWSQKNRMKSEEERRRRGQL